MATTLTREELYEAIWSEPTARVARRMGISYVALAKACRSANVPRPQLGYWARKAAGKKVLPGPAFAQPPEDMA